MLLDSLINSFSDNLNALEPFKAFQNFFTEKVKNQFFGSILRLQSNTF